MAMLIFLCGFLSGVLVGVMVTNVTSRWIRPGQAAFREAQPTEITGARQSDPMATDQQDSPTVEEMPSHTDISTEPVPHGLLSQFRAADGKLAHDKGLFVAGSMAFKTFDCTGNGKSTWYCSSEVSPGQSYCRPCSVCGPIMDSPMVWVCSFPCNVYHSKRGCGRLKGARHVISLAICQCKSCCEFWHDS